MRLDCGGFSIRSYRDADLEALVRHGDNSRVAANLRDRFPHPYTLDDARRWLGVVRAQDPEMKFALDIDGELVGAIGLEPGSDVYRRSAELGYWLGEAFWGRGIATAAVRCFTRWGFETFDLLRIEAYVFDDNPGSQRVLEKAGFEIEGRMRRAVVKEGRVLDQLVYARLRDSEAPC